MTVNSMNTYNDILSWAQKVASTTDSTVLVDGVAFGQTGEHIYSETVIPFEDGGKVEIKLLLPAASNAFEWTTEITLDDTDGGYKHYLLRKAGDIVETYGKQVIPVADQDAQALYAKLQSLTGITV